MLYLSSSKGTGGEIKRSPDEFIVKEITRTGKILELNMQYSPEQLGMKVDPEGKFANFVLQKRDWNTIQALQNVAKRLGRGVKSIGYAGMKDRTATSTQIASIFGVSAQALANVNMKDIRVNGAWQSKNPVELGDLLGNAFEITIIGSKNSENIPKIFEELGGRIPNYFDAQRFGNRLNNAKVGTFILQNRLEDAAMEFLTGTTNENNQNAVAARNKLKEEGDFGAALEYFPGYLKHERTMIYHLAKEGTDFAKALRSIPRGISILFIHAVEAAIFNYAAERMVKENAFEDSKLFCGLDLFGFPDLEKLGSAGKEVPVSTIIGYETKEEEINEYEREALEKLGIKKEGFKIRSMPELSMRGTYRPLLAPFKEEKYEQLSEDLVKVSFALPSGAYATILLGEITKSSPLDLELVSPMLKF
ncbi:MAG: tRNA pseudouridine(13) synthase TruD [Candidatus Micrarchaeota archaeon]|nr:tRNA pseudouridine(13) synthase TruD [Candidatus Micrarchaeota archaeon]